MVADVGVSRYPGGGEQPERLRRLEQVWVLYNETWGSLLPHPGPLWCRFYYWAIFCYLGSAYKDAGTMPAWKKP